RWYRAGPSMTGFVDGDAFLSIVPERDVDVLDLGARQKLLDRLLAPDARLLVAAEGHPDPVLRGAVDPDKTGFDLRREPMRTFEIVGPDRAGQPDVEGVDALEHVVLVTPAQDAHDRSEDLLAADAHVCGDG